MKTSFQAVRILALAVAVPPPAVSQTPAIPPTGRVVCPGDPAANLTSIDCRFTRGQRLEQFVSSSLTDQAALGSVFYGLMAQLEDDPAEWKRGWNGFGYRVGTRYAQNLAKGITESVLGAIMVTDPRNVSYASDPGVKTHKPGVGPRLGHVFKDWITVRRSSVNGAGPRWLNVPMFAGAAASGFTGDWWYPNRLATPQQAGLRASFSLATALGGSFYTEFEPDVSRLLGGIFKRGRVPKTNPQAAGSKP